MGFKMKGYSGFHGDKKSAFTRDIARDMAPLAEDEYFEGLERKKHEPLPDIQSKITDKAEWDELQNLHDEDYKYTDEQWNELMNPTDEIWDQMEGTDKLMTNKYYDRQVWDRGPTPDGYRKPEPYTDMPDVGLRPERSLAWGTSGRDIPKNADYKLRVAYKTWKKKLRNKGFRGTEIDNTWEEFLRQRELGVVEGIPNPVQAVTSGESYGEPEVSGGDGDTDIEPSVNRGITWDPNKRMELMAGLKNADDNQTQLIHGQLGWQSDVGEGDALGNLNKTRQTKRKSSNGAKKEYIPQTQRRKDYIPQTQRKTKGKGKRVVDPETGEHISGKKKFIDTKLGRSLSNISLDMSGLDLGQFKVSSGTGGWF
tara:strand:+ start:1685 stop:2785 length:1101 start_codon:yes stop_codon:yes gene_type:complete